MILVQESQFLVQIQKIAVYIPEKILCIHRESRFHTVPELHALYQAQLAICRGDRLRGRRVLRRSGGSGQAGLTFRHRADFREPPGAGSPLILMQLVGEKISQELLKIVNLCNVEDVTKHVIAKVIACTYTKCVAWWLKEKETTQKPHASGAYCFHDRRLLSNWSPSLAECLFASRAVGCHVRGTPKHGLLAQRKSGPQTSFRRCMRKLSSCIIFLPISSKNKGDTGVVGSVNGITLKLVERILANGKSEVLQEKSLVFLSGMNHGRAEPDVGPLGQLNLPWGSRVSNTPKGISEPGEQVQRWCKSISELQCYQRLEMSQCRRQRSVCISRRQLYPFCMIKSSFLVNSAAVTGAVLQTAQSLTMVSPLCSTLCTAPVRVSTPSSPGVANISGWRPTELLWNAATLHPGGFFSAVPFLKNVNISLISKSPQAIIPHTCMVKTFASQRIAEVTDCEC
ncbi:hypothetical protein Anapl_03960 [Anas platyrhynchos]|uniref:Uncharacterized protein n=1 Tax=Anas platyrhynchos TaxID=8839 RepID=R0KFU7_ANAPL|nr:hypothetical protein Anapl_03960 [Anas platyrhynchos]